MRTFPNFPMDGVKQNAFEIENAYIAPSTVGAILAQVTGVTNVQVRRPFDAFREVHVRFDYKGSRCIVWEPNGDSSRYWIGADEGQPDIDVRSLEDAFKRYDPPLLRRVVGDLLSLRFLEKLFGRPVHK